CDRVAVLDRGKLAALGKPDELLRGGPRNRAVLYGHLRQRPPRYLERAIRQRLGPGVGLEITGRRLRLAADSRGGARGALALLLGEGVEGEASRPPAGSVERLLRDDHGVAPTPSGAG